MFVYYQSLAGVTDFDGLTLATGALDFGDFYDFDEASGVQDVSQDGARQVTAVVYGYGFSCPTGTADLTISLGFAGGKEFQIVNETTISQHVTWCGPQGLVVPVGIIGGGPMGSLHFVTANKTQEADIACWWGIRTAPS